MSPLSAASSPFPSFPVSNITIPATPLVVASLDFLKAHTRLSTVNHCLRSVAFALVLIGRLPIFSGIQLDTELVAVSVLLHDMGWATTPGMLSMDTRFEVDGANIAREFLTNELKKKGNQSDHGHGKSHWDAHHLQLVWDAIALHTTPSIAFFKEPEVAAAHLGIGADFTGPYLSIPPGSPPAELGALVRVEEYQEIVAAFPRENFKGDLVTIMCGLCRDKRDTTFDNLVGEFGLEFGTDGNGGGREEYTEEWKARRTLPFIMNSLDRSAEFE